jgi:hypothetical protein
LEIIYLQTHSYASVEADSGTLAYEQVANWQVRNAGSWAGNLVMAKTKNFASDIATLAMGAGATLTVLGGAGRQGKQEMSVRRGARTRGTLDRVLTCIALDRFSGEGLPVGVGLDGQVRESVSI